MKEPDGFSGFSRGRLVRIELSSEVSANTDLALDEYGDVADIYINHTLST